MTDTRTEFVHLSAPVVKDIETGEGILVYITNAVIYLAAILPHGLSWTHAALFVTILNAVHVFQRGLAKAVTAGKSVGLTPIPPSGVPPVPSA